MYLSCQKKTGNRQRHSIVDFSNSEVLNIAAVDVHLRIIPIVGGVSNPEFCCCDSKIGVRNPSNNRNSRQLNASG